MAEAARNAPGSGLSSSSEVAGPVGSSRLCWSARGVPVRGLFVLCWPNRRCESHPHEPRSFRSTPITATTSRPSSKDRGLIMRKRWPSSVIMLEGCAPVAALGRGSEPGEECRHRPEVRVLLSSVLGRDVVHTQHPLGQAVRAEHRIRSRDHGLNPDRIPPEGRLS